jgi:hypothetical protein
MDNDHLFVCFSMEAANAPEGAPPFHDDIKKFAREIDRNRFRRFFEDRYHWHWYPIISSGFSSFPTHGDLHGELSEEKRHECIGFAAEICSEEDGKRFISALGLLTLLCRSCDAPSEVESLTKYFMRIRDKVTANAIDPNIHYWFSKIVLFQIATGVSPLGYVETFDRAGLNAPKENKG